jgi:hypothetical protein
LFFPETANSDTSCYFDFCFLQALEKANSPSLRIVLVGSLTGSDRSLAVLGLVLMEGLVRVFCLKKQYRTSIKVAQVPAGIACVPFS